MNGRNDGRVGRTGSIPLWMVGFVLAAFFSACGGSSAQQQAFDSNQALWASQQLSHYHFTLQIGCFCPEDITSPALLEVQNGVVLSGTYASSNQPVDPSNLQSFLSIEQLFTELQRAIDTAGSVTVSYNQTMGYPEHISIDWIKDAVDDEMAYTASGVEGM